LRGVQQQRIEICTIRTPRRRKDLANWIERCICQRHRANVASNITSFRVPHGAITLASPMATRDLRLRDKPGVPPSRLCLSIDCVWSATRVVCTVSVGNSLCWSRN